MKARRIRKLDPRASLREGAARTITVRLGELRTLAQEAIEPSASVAQHDLRIAAKRLRYVLEVTGACFGEEADAARRAAKSLQDILGEIHDCDEMLPRVEAQVAALRGEDSHALLLSADGAGEIDPALLRKVPNRAAYRGLEMLAVHVQARRALLFERFAELWDKHERRGTWAALERVL